MIGSESLESDAATSRVAEEVANVGADFWRWRLDTILRTSDDVPRITRNSRWRPRFDQSSIESVRRQRQVLSDRWAAIDLAAASVSTQVDHRLIGSALARVHWEIDIMRSWERDAMLQVQQALGPYFDLLLQPPPFEAERVDGIIAQLGAIPEQLAVAQENLARAGIACLAEAAVKQLSSIDRDLPASVDALTTFVDPTLRQVLVATAAVATDALVSFREWLSERVPSMTIDASPGRDHFRWYLHHVALLPREPEELLTLARYELDRTTVWEAVVENQVRETPLPPLPPSAEAQVEVERRQELEIREFMDREHLLSAHLRLANYFTAPMPPYLEPISWLGVPNDLTDADRLDQDASSYTTKPVSTLGYFAAANARDPRLGIVHEGAHYRQLAISWQHADPIRRQYYDSIANEGLAHYNEELMLQAGLFDDAPRSRPIIYNFARLRALRVLVDIGLAIGEMTLDEAIETFVRDVGMDRTTAFLESTMYLSNPGLAMSYFVGKAELLRLVADARSRLGPGFDLQSLHDNLYLNGNVPFALQRWEILADDSDLTWLDEHA